MKTIKTNNPKVMVKFTANGGDENDITVTATELNTDSGFYEYWFTVGQGYKSMKTAKRAAVRVMAKYGYMFNEKQLERL